MYYRYLVMSALLWLCVACANREVKPPTEVSPTLALPPTLPILSNVITDAPSIFPTELATTMPTVAMTRVPATSSPNAAMVSGLIWQDSCQMKAEGVPSLGCVATGDGQYQADGQFNQNEGRIANITVTLNLGTCPGQGQPFATTTTNSDGVYQFDNLLAGTYCIKIDPTNQSMLDSGNWSYPAPGVGYMTVVVPINGNGVANFGWDYRRSQSKPQPSAAACTNEASYVADVTIPDNTVIPAGEAFVKTWRIQNEGSCTWTTTYALAFDGGAQMEAPIAMPLPQEVAPGEQVEISVSFTAPAERGVYRSDWLLRSPDGQTFGSRNDYPFYVQIAVKNDSATLPNAEADAAMIGGVIWVDSCQSAASNCVPDGQLNNNEAHLAGVQVRLNPGPCPGSEALFSAATSDVSGIYRFDNVAAGTYCVSINPLLPANEALLMPGDWTYPAKGIGSATVTVGAGEQKTADFGWDYQNR